MSAFYSYRAATYYLLSWVAGCAISMAATNLVIHLTGEDGALWMLWSGLLAVPTIFSVFAHMFGLVLPDGITESEAVACIRRRVFFITIFGGLGSGPWLYFMFLNSDLEMVMMITTIIWTINMVGASLVLGSLTRDFEHCRTAGLWS